MKITKIDIAKLESESDGIDNIKMNKLGDVVLIAGKNGAGKTRILNKIFHNFRSKPTVLDIKYSKSQIEQLNDNRKNFEQQIQEHQANLLATNDEFNILNNNAAIAQLKQFITNSENQIKDFTSRINWSKIESSESSEKSFSSIHFVPKNLILTDCNSFSKADLLAYATNINLGVGVENLQHGTFAKIQVVQDRWFHSTHDQIKITEEERKKAIDDYLKLKNIIKIFLNTDIDRTINGDATIFGLRIGNSQLSDGQKILLQFCIAIYSQEADLKDLILVLDEPENHLHPSVIIEIIERIKNCVPSGQIWIATHSIPLLAHFDPSLIWYVENGKITHAGKIPEKVLSSLLGNEDEVAKLQDFISLPSQYATSRYAFESLFEPTVVQTDSNDPQSFQIRTDLLKLTSNGKLRILDYGSGKGRLISNIVDLDETNQEKLIKGIDYIAYDKFENDKEQCESALIKAYGTCDKRYFNDFNKLFSFYDRGSFDVIIMCNVLHEIDPKDWLSLFKIDGEITNLLSEKGILLLIEDHQIPIGEKAYQKGFLVLDTPQLKELFKITEKDTDFSFSDSRGDGRLKAHQIPKRLLSKIDETSRLHAIKSLSDLAKNKILDIREKEKNYQNGKLHGFWTQQFANAQLNLSELTAK